MILDALQAFKDGGECVIRRPGNAKGRDSANDLLYLTNQHVEGRSFLRQTARQGPSLPPLGPLRIDTFFVVGLASIASWLRTATPNLLAFNKCSVEARIRWASEGKTLTDLPIFASLALYRQTSEQSALGN